MFGTLEAKLIGVAAAALMVFSAGAYTAHKFDAGRYQTLVASVQKAHADALQQALARQQALDRAAMNASDDEAQAQQQLADQAKLQLSEVQKYVKVVHIAPRCVPYGLVRLLDAAAIGRSAEHLSNPAGKSDDACSPLGWDDLARTTVSNYGFARSNAEQLNALIHFYRSVK